MRVAREQTDPCTFALEIEVDADTVNRAFDRAYREFARATTVPGFRPGKAPRAILERYVNQDMLRDRARELAAGQAYREALRQENITPYGEPEIDLPDIAEGQPWKFRAVVPTPPVVELGDYSDLRVERPVHPVTEDDVDAQLEELRAEHARLVAVSGRGVAPGDAIIAETAVAPVDEELPEPRRTLIHMGRNVPGFDEAVLGQMPEEERTFELDYPEDYQDPRLAGKRVRLRVRLAAINQRVLPEVTDEWVRATTPYQTVADLRDALRERLERSYADMSDRVAEVRIVSELIRRSTLKYPAAMVRAEMQAEFAELAEELERRGTTYEQYLASRGITEEQHHEELARTAVDRVEATLVLRELARREGVTVSERDVDAELDAMARDSGLDAEALDRLRHNPARRRRIADLLIRRKLRELLFRIATIADVPAPAA